MTTTDPNKQANDRTRIDMDGIFESLTSKYRRRIIRELDKKPTITINDAIVAADGSNAKSRHHMDKESSREIQLVLKHAHLPKLEDAKIVEVSADGEEISRGGQFDTASTALLAVEEKVE